VIVVRTPGCPYTPHVVIRGEERCPSCRRCGLPLGKANVRINRTGVCNYCRFWDGTGQTLLAAERGSERLAERLAPFRDRYPYDVGAGLSGGKDSAYVLYRLISDYGLHVLAVTYDNGFLTPYAHENVRSIVQTTQVEHLFYRPQWEAFRAFYRAALRRLGDPCVACSIGGYALSIKGCLERRIPFFVHGRSPLQMFRSAHQRSRDLGIGLIQANLAEHSFDRLARQYSRLRRRLRWFLRFLEPNGSRRAAIFGEFFDFGRPDRASLPEFLAFFLYEPYDEQAIKAHLEQRETGYRRPSDDVPLGHADCLIHEACAHLYKLQHGISKVALEAAALVRQGGITRQEAERTVALNRPEKQELDESIDCLLERLDLTRREYDAICARLRARQRRLLPDLA
jgi:hypothetical protein